MLFLAHFSNFIFTQITTRFTVLFLLVISFTSAFLETADNDDGGDGNSRGDETIQDDSPLLLKRQNEVDASPSNSTIASGPEEFKQRLVVQEEINKEREVLLIPAGVVRKLREDSNSTEAADNSTADSTTTDDPAANVTSSASPSPDTPAPDSSTSDPATTVTTTPTVTTAPTVTTTPTAPATVPPAPSTTPVPSTGSTDSSPVANTTVAATTGSNQTGQPTSSATTPTTTGNITNNVGAVNSTGTALPAKKGMRQQGLWTALFYSSIGLAVLGLLGTVLAGVAITRKGLCPARKKKTRHPKQEPSSVAGSTMSTVDMSMAEVTLRSK